MMHLLLVGQAGYRHNYQTDLGRASEVLMKHDYPMFSYEEILVKLDLYGG